MNRFIAAISRLFAGKPKAGACCCCSNGARQTGDSCQSDEKQPSTAAQSGK